MAEQKRIQLKLVRSPIGCKPKHRATLRGLGLRRMHQQVDVEDTPCTRGMINKISYLLEVVEN